MHTAMNRLVFRLSIFAFSFVSASALADDAASTAQVAADAVRIELIAQPKEVELPSQFHIALRVVNPSSEPVIFRSFDLRPLEEPGGLKITEECRKQAQAALGANSSRPIMCQLRSDGFDDSLSGFAYSLLSSWSLITLQPGDYRFVATAEFRNSSSGTSTVSTTIVVKIRPTVWQVCFGAAFGALLLVIFAFSSSRVRALLVRRDRVKDATWYRLWIIEPVTLWLGASVSASIFIFLTYRLKDVSGPFTITVNDFYGGIVLGLFGVFLADWLTGKLFVATTKSSGDKSAN